MTFAVGQSTSLVILNSSGIDVSWKAVEEQQDLEKELAGAMPKHHCSVTAFHATKLTNQWLRRKVAIFSYNPSCVRWHAFDMQQYRSGYEASIART